MVRKRAIHPF